MVGGGNTSPGFATLQLIVSWRLVTFHGAGRPQVGLGYDKMPEDALMPGSTALGHTLGAELFVLTPAQFRRVFFDTGLTEMRPLALENRRFVASTVRQPEMESATIHERLVALGVWQPLEELRHKSLTALGAGF